MSISDSSQRRCTLPIQNRDNAYYKQRVRKDRPDLADEVAAGRMSVTKARQLAGLGATRNPLNELKRAWTKASADEKAAFRTWAGLSSSAPTSTPTAPALPPAIGPVVKPDGFMTDWAKKRVMEIIAHRRMMPGDLAVELGLKRLDASVVMAIKGDVRLKPAKAAALEAWLMKNAAV